MNNPNKRDHPNKLIHESSPYLLEHAHNPVHWYPWGKAALEKAKNENKPMIISIGYASCHWCHVMEKESYSSQEVADYMNKHFVAIKVDREERPDIDQIYMNTSMLLNGNGGWPLNAFSLPDGKPFYVVTYLQEEQWLQLLQQIVSLYENRYDDLKEQADTLTHGVINHQIIQPPKDKEKQDLKKLYHSLYEKMATTIDFKNGGFNRAPKFPLPVAWEWLLQEYYLNKNEKALAAVELTLEKMALGGIYDQIGGGFARYATDSQWKIPHFEKMLYDNGQLISLYAKAYKITQKPIYKEVIKDTLSFIRRKMTDENGGFYASINADSEGEEGKFYVWSEKEIKAILSPETAPLMLSFYQISHRGNWENGKNILLCTEKKEEFAKKHGMKPEEWEKILLESKEKLFYGRENRIKPTIDNKILVSWNALMLKGYIDAFSALGEKEYLDIALKNALFLAEEMIGEKGQILRNYMNGKAGIEGLLEDYAQLSDAYIALYQVTFDKKWLDLSEKLIKYVWNHFQEEGDCFFYYTSDKATSLIARKKEIEDNVIPASNSVIARVLFKLGTYLDKKTYLQRAKDMLEHIAHEIPTAVPYFANWAQLLGEVQQDVFEVAIIGKETLIKNLEMQKQFLPLSLWMGGEEENIPLLKGKAQPHKTIIYVCKNKVCKQPVKDTQSALSQMDS